MIVQLFNSGVISGPETLVFPSLSLFGEEHALVLLVEKRLGEKGRAPLEHARAFGLRVEAVEVESRFDLAAVGKLRGILRGLGPRIVHAHDVKATTYAWLAERGGRWKLVSTHHGVAGRPDWKTRLYERLYSGLVLPCTDMAIVVSREDEYLLRQRGLNPQHLAYVPNGVTRRLWEGAERERERSRLRALWRRDFEVPADHVLLGIVGRLSAEKRHSYLFRSLAALKRARPELRWRLLVVGSGALEAQLKAEAMGLDIEGDVHWLGYQPDAHALMPGLDVLLIPSSAEGLPVAALEAGWAGVPVMASNVGGLPELIRTGGEAGGVIFPREQEHAHTALSLAWLVENAAEREQFGQRLQERVARDYSAEAWVRRMEEVYRSL